MLEQKRAQAALAQAKLDVSLAQQDLRFGLRSLSIMWGEQTPSFKRVEGDLLLLTKLRCLMRWQSQSKVALILISSPNKAVCKLRSFV